MLVKAAGLGFELSEEHIEEKDRRLNGISVQKAPSNLREYLLNRRLVNTYLEIFQWPLFHHQTSENVPFRGKMEHTAPFLVHLPAIWWAT
jgi:hypothetical protein